MATIEEARRGRTHWRNPVLARYLQAGTGLPRAIRETIALAGSAPRFEVDDWFRVTVPAYYPDPEPTTSSPDDADLGDGVLVISIGHGVISPATVRRSNSEVQKIPEKRFKKYHHPGLATKTGWGEMLREFRDWLRECMEDSAVNEFHVFYRGPVAVGPLIGAMAVNRKPLRVYVFDEDLGWNHGDPKECAS